jgi:hypothetical protein
MHPKECLTLFMSGSQSKAFTDIQRGFNNHGDDSMMMTREDIKTESGENEPLEE